MFARTSKPRPPSHPFQHATDCKTSDAELQWLEEGDGTWRRVCSCGSESWYDQPAATTRPAATLDAEQHRHSTLPDGEPCTATALVVFEDGGWKSRCGLCGTTTFGPEWRLSPGVSRQALKELDEQGRRLDAEMAAARERAYAAVERRNRRYR